MRNWGPERLSNFLTSLSWSLSHFEFPQKQTQDSSTHGFFRGFSGGASRRQWHPTPVFLPGKSHGWRSLVGCSPWGLEESDTTEQLHFHFSLSCIGEGDGNPLQCSCLENPRDGGAWWAAIYGVTQSRTGLQRLSSSSASGKEPTCHAGDIETQVWSLGWEDPLEEGVATHSSILTWRTPWTEELGSDPSKHLA